MRNSGAQQRPTVADQAGYRVAGQVAIREGGNVAGNRETSGNESREAVRAVNAWSDPAGRVHAQGDHTGHQNGDHANGYRRSHSYQPYLRRYYGGYYPIYIDIPVVYYAPGIDVGYDGGPALVPDPGSDSVAPVIPPSSISVSAQDDATAQPAPAPNPENPAPDSAQDSSHAPNPSIGPDSLVEAVQSELARRGYYQGTVDAMFRPDTEAAVRHFQQDNYLAPTGHLNEPTLHALNLE